MDRRRWWAPQTVLALGALAALAAGAHRVAADAPAGRYTVTSGGTPSGTVTDTVTGLVWQQAVPTSTFTWANAGTYCTTNAGSLPGAGWRLPSLTELQTLVDDSRQSPAIDPVAFPGTPAEHFWTSSPWAGNPSLYAMQVNFVFGGAGAEPLSNPHRAKCVR